MGVERQRKEQCVYCGSTRGPLVDDGPGKKCCADQEACEDRIMRRDEREARRSSTLTPRPQPVAADSGPVAISSYEPRPTTGGPVVLSEQRSFHQQIGLARMVILGKSGAGKTNADVVIVEELVRNAGIPVFVLDPLGNMWGLRYAGRGAGLPVVIFGGLHADVEICEADGGYLADYLATAGISAVIDLSEFDLKEQREFAEGFLMRLMYRVTSPVHVVLEEADRFAPNTIGKNPVKTWARTARNKAIGWTFSTQRGQILSPEVIESSSAIVAMKMTGDLAQGAMLREIRSRVGRDTAAGIVDDLPTLRRGEAWLVPDSEWMADVDIEDALPERIQFRVRSTFDSARPPRVGETPPVPGEPAVIDLAAVRAGLRDMLGPIAKSGELYAQTSSSDEASAIDGRVLEALREAGGRLLRQEIGAACELTEWQVAACVQRLSQRRLVVTKRGKNGGILLANAEADTVSA